METDWQKIDIPANLKDIQLNTDLICLEECKSYTIKDGKFIFSNDAEVRNNNKIVLIILISLNNYTYLISKYISDYY